MDQRTRVTFIIAALLMLSLAFTVYHWPIKFFLTPEQYHEKRGTGYSPSSTERIKGIIDNRTNSYIAFIGEDWIIEVSVHPDSTFREGDEVIVTFKNFDVESFTVTEEHHVISGESVEVDHYPTGKGTLGLYSFIFLLLILIISLVYQYNEDPKNFSREIGEMNQNSPYWCSYIFSIYHCSTAFLAYY